jgi:uncharacterized membrane protein
MASFEESVRGMLQSRPFAVARQHGLPVLLSSGASTYAAARQSRPGRAVAGGLRAAVSVAAARARARPPDRFERATTIARPLAEVYGFWRDLGNLPRVIEPLASVDALDETHSRWLFSGPAGTSFAWEATLVGATENRWLGLTAKTGPVQVNINLFFGPAPGRRGSEVRVAVETYTPLPRLSRRLAKLLGDLPKQLVAASLRNSKRLLEAGEITRGASA